MTQVASTESTRTGWKIILSLEVLVFERMTQVASTAALVAAGLLSVIIYPLIALTLLRSRKGEEKLDEEKPLPYIESMLLSE
jgi:hypothetical protein